MNERQKQLRMQYKERKVVGGIYRILNQKNGRFYLNKTANLDAAKNMFKSCITTGSCTNPRLSKEWHEYGNDAFVFEVLEIWEKDVTQTDKEFQNDLEELLEIWSKKLPQGDRY